MATSGISNRVRITGMSGFDTQTMVEQLMNAESYKVNSAKQSLIKMQWRQEMLRETANSLRTFRDTFLSYTAQATNFRSATMFKANKATVKVSGETSTGLSVTTSNTSKAGKYNVELKQLAQKDTYTSTKGLSKLTGKADNFSNLKEGDSFGINFDGKLYTIEIDKEDLEDGGANFQNNIQAKIDTALGKEGADGSISKVKLDFSGGNISLTPTAGHTVSLSDISSNKATAGVTLNLNNKDLLTKINEKGLKLDVDGTEFSIGKDFLGKGDFAGLSLENDEDVVKIAQLLADKIAADVQAKYTTPDGQPPGMEGSATSQGNGVLIFAAGNGEREFTLKNYNGYSEDDPKPGDMLSFKDIGLDVGTDGKTLANYSVVEDMGFARNATTTNMTSSSLEELLGADAFKADGTAEIEINTHKISLTKDMSLDDLMKKVNESGAGVTMSYSSFSGTVSLTSNETGSNNAMDLKDNAGMIFDKLGLRQTSVAQDAIFLVNGEQTTRTSNSFYLEGGTEGTRVTFDQNTAVGTSYEINVGADNENVISNIKKFIESYNSLLSGVSTKVSEPRAKSGSYGYYEPLLDEEKSAMSESEVKLWEEKAKQGLLYRDDTLGKIATDMRSWMFEAVDLGGGKKISLHEIGVTTGAWYDGGALTVDEDKLRKALEDRPDDVAALFTKTSDITRGTKGKSGERYKTEGLAYRLDDIINEAINNNTGSLVLKAGIKGSSSDSENALSKQMRDQNDKIDRMLELLTQKENRYYAMFSAMEQAMTNANNQLSYLTAQIGQ